MEVATVLGEDSEDRNTYPARMAKAPGDRDGGSGTGSSGPSGKPEEEELVVDRARIDDNAVSGDARTAAEWFA